MIDPTYCAVTEAMGKRKRHAKQAPMWGERAAVNARIC
jgi:hypothetical protein